MAIAHVHTDTTKDISSTTSATAVVLPTGTASTDVVIAVFGIDTAGGNASGWTVTAPAGWTKIGSNQLDVDAGAPGVVLFAFWALGSVANLSFTNSRTGDSQGVVVAAFSGVDNTTPIDVLDTTGSSSTGSTSATATAITTVTNNAWELIAAADWLSGSFTSAGFTVSENGHTNCAAALLYNTTPVSPAGSTGTKTVSDSQSATGQVIVLRSFALRPAAAAANPQGWQTICPDRTNDRMIPMPY
ncbi:MAG: hypothetical protein KGL39_33380 [Patescibacteria group bacterium]|nr:hypothetical protein [Patescibacteria group bacterium]